MLVPRLIFTLLDHYPFRCDVSLTMMKRISCMMGLITLMVSLPSTVYGQGSLYVPGQSVLRTITDEDAILGRVTLDVASGYGLNLSFQRLNEKIIKVWIDDMSELLIDFDRELPETKVIHLRRLQEGELPLQTRSISRDTLMTVVTERRIYQFFIRLRDTRMNYKTVEIVPTMSQLVPIGAQGFATLEQVEQGIQNAIEERRIDRDSILIPRVRKFIILVRQGKTLEEASSEAGISLATVAEFGRIGKRIPNVLERLRKPK